MNYWDRADAQPALRARHEDRLGWSRDFWCNCGQPAFAKLVYVRDDGSEQARTRPLCKTHYHKSLDIWNRLVAAGTVTGLTVSVTR